jgi:hypothetical protein
MSQQKLQLAGVLAEVNDDLERAVRSLTVELADLKATLAEVRLVFATDRTQASSCPSCRCDLARCSDAVAVAEAPGRAHRAGLRGGFRRRQLAAGRTSPLAPNVVCHRGPPRSQ